MDDGPHATMQRVLHAHADESPGACAFYLDAEEKPHSAAVGFADMNWRVGFDRDVRVNCGSIAKVINAQAVKRFCESGELSLDDTLGRLMRGIPEDIGSLQVRDLLDCRTSLRDYNSAIRLLGCDPESTHSGSDLIGAAVAQSEEQAAVHKLDHFWYSSTNWMILGAALQLLTRTPVERLFDDVTGGVGQLARTRGALTLERCAQGYARSSRSRTGWAPQMLFADGIGASNFFASAVEISLLIRRLCPSDIDGYGYHQGWLHLPDISVAAGADGGFCTCVVVVRESREVIGVVANAGNYPSARTALLLVRELVQGSAASEVLELLPRSPGLPPSSVPVGDREFRNDQYGVRLITNRSSAEFVRQGGPPIVMHWCANSGLYVSGLVNAANHDDFAFVSHDGCYPIRLTAS